MNVRELITELSKHDMNAEVIVTVYNGIETEYEPVGELEGGRFVPYTYVTGPKAVSGDFHATGTYRAHSDIGTPAVLILPTV